LLWRRWSGSRLDRNAQLRDQVLAQLRIGLSPQQVAARSAEGIGTETTYRFIYSQ